MALLLPNREKVNCNVENSDILEHEVALLSEGADATH